jgi:uncharacterized glyoxalase superfamily protein PhnB
MDTPRVRFDGITPYLHYDDAAAMIAWFERVFGFREVGRHTNEHGVVSNAELKVGGTEIWIDGDATWWTARGGGPDQWLGVWVDDVDAMFAHVTTAGLIVSPPVDKPYGVRQFEAKDPQGYIWGFMQRIS